MKLLKIIFFTSSISIKLHFINKKIINNIPACIIKNKFKKILN
jgi:hypothetical protein